MCLISLAEERNLADMLAGVSQFIEEALQGGATLALLSSTCSSPKEGLVEAALKALGPDVSSQLRVFQCPQSGPVDAEDTAADDAISSLEKSLKKATAQACCCSENFTRSDTLRLWQDRNKSITRDHLIIIVLDRLIARAKS